MNILQTIILGTIQGLTEFLPISSSGHLILAEKGLKGFTRPGICLEIFLHMGTLLAVLVYFRKDIQNIIRDIFSRKHESPYQGRKWALLIFLGSIPTAVIGFLFESWIEIIFTSLSVVGFGLIITGLLLWISDHFKKRGRGIDRMKICDAFGIGLIQGMALIPGISRSGSTITLGIILGIDRDTAARFSFLLGIPAQIGAFFFELKQISHTLSINFSNYLLGALIAAVIGFLCIHLLLKMVISKRLYPFAFYCWLIGLIALFFV